MLKKQWHNLEFQVHRDLKANRIVGKKLILAVSGGADSVALLCIINSLAKAMKLQLVVAHFHHGRFDNARFRNRALSFCRQLAKKYNLKFYYSTSKKKLISEDDCRNARYAFLKQIKNKIGADYIVTAHQQDDLLETRMMRLIRGVGSQGLLAMQFCDDDKLRPLLMFTRAELDQYLHSIRQKYLTDPTNLQSKHSFRNWLRLVWLPELESRQPGGLKSLARSLENLSHSEDFIPQQVMSTKGLSRPVYLSLTERQQISALAKYLQTAKILDFTLGQLHEIKKNLDKPKTVHKFSVGGIFWTVNAKQIVAVSKR